MPALVEISSTPNDGAENDTVDPEHSCTRRPTFATRHDIDDFFADAMLNRLTSCWTLLRQIMSYGRFKRNGRGSTAYFTLLCDDARDWWARAISQVSAAD